MQIPKVLSVSELNRLVRNVIETNFPSVWIEGEISNFSCPSSGHWYLILKDERSKLDAPCSKMQKTKQISNQRMDNLF